MHRVNVVNKALANEARTTLLASEVLCAKHQNYMNNVAKVYAHMLFDKN